MDNNFNQDTQYNQDAQYDQYGQYGQASTFGGNAGGNTNGMYVKPTKNKVVKIIVIIAIILALLCCCCCGGIFGLAYIGEKDSSDVDSEINDILNDLPTDVIKDSSEYSNPTSNIDSIEAFTNYFKDKEGYDLYSTDEGITYNSVHLEEHPSVGIDFYVGNYIDYDEFINKVMFYANIDDESEILNAEVGQLSNGSYLYEFIDNADYQRCIVSDTDGHYYIISRKGNTLVIGADYAENNEEKRQKLREVMNDIGY